MREGSRPKSVPMHRRITHNFAKLLCELLTCLYDLGGWNVVKSFLVGA